MKYFLGVDGGGTKTEAVLIDQNRKVLGRGQAGGVLIPVLGWQESINNLYIAIKRAISEKKLQKISSCLALAGVDTKGNNLHWKQIIMNHQHLSKILASPLIVNDTLAALRAGTTDQDAVVIIAGTGSNCYGRNDRGQEAKSGGAGHILGDEGSAFVIGSEILKSVVRSLDGRISKTVLTKLVFETCHINSLESLINLIYEKPWNKTDIAQVAPLADKAVKEKDPVAKKIIENAAHELALMGKAVITKLKLKGKFYTAVLSGSVFNIQTLKEKLQQELLEFSPKAKFVKPSMSSAEAAAILALEEKF